MSDKQSSNEKKETSPLKKTGLTSPSFFNDFSGARREKIQEHLNQLNTQNMTNPMTRSYVDVFA
jgi:hypothetical protein